MKYVKEVRFLKREHLGKAVVSRSAVIKPKLSKQLKVTYMSLIVVHFPYNKDSNAVHFTGRRPYQSRDKWQNLTW